jgi:MFS family permease
VSFLVAAIFGLRLFGQGLLSHAASASMARYFRAGRGRALGIAGLGHPLGEAVLPLPAVALAALIGWRVSWALVAALMIFAALPVALWLLRGHAERQRNWLDHRVPEARHTGGVEIKWTRAEVVRDPVFYYLLPASLASSYVMTGFFFHQAHLAQTKGWPLTLIAGSFTAWALASVVAALITGDLVDRRGATRMMPFALVPMCAGLAALSATDSPLAAPVYLGVSRVSPRACT